MHMHHIDPEIPCACTTLRKAARAMGRLYDDAMASTGMTTAQFSILRNVGRGEPLALSRLAEQLVMERTTLYRAIAPLEARGWVSISSPKGKTKLASLTDAGRAAMAAAAPEWESAQQRILGRLGDNWTGIEFALRALTNIAQRA